MFCDKIWSDYWMSAPSVSNVHNITPALLLREVKSWLVWRATRSSLYLGALGILYISRGQVGEGHVMVLHH